MFDAVITTIIDAQQSNALDLTTPSAGVNTIFRRLLAEGGGLNQANAIFSDNRVLIASGTESLDLSGILVAPLGGVLAFTKIKEILIRASASNPGDLRVGKNVINAMIGPFGAAAPGVLVPPGGLLHLANPTAAGWAVIAGTGDLLSVENLSAAGSVAYDIVLIGAV